MVLDFSIYLQMFAVTLFPVTASGFFYFLQQKTAVKKIPYPFSQLILGLIFGFFSILGTNLGVDIDIPSTGIVTLNVRDTAPLCAGLIFGGPAGIIAGCIGALHRYFGVAWGLSSYTQLACTLATLFAGIIAALTHKIILEKDTPVWGLGLAIGSATEVFHILLILVTHMTDIEYAFSIVQCISLPMISMNGLGVMLACLAVSMVNFIQRGKMHKRMRNTIGMTMQRYLLFFISAACIASFAFSWTVLQFLSKSTAEQNILTNLVDVNDDIKEAAETEVSSFVQTIAAIVDYRITGNCLTDASLIQLNSSYGLTELNIIDTNGIITMSTNSDNVGYDMNSGDQSKAFLSLIGSSTYSTLIQDFQPTSRDNSLSRKYAACVISDGSLVQIGYDTDRYHDLLQNQILSISRNRHIQKSGYIIVADSDYSILTDSTEFVPSDSGFNVEDFMDVSEGVISVKTVSGQDCYCEYITSEGFYILGILPLEEANLYRDISGYLNLFIMSMIFVLLFLMVFLAIRKHIVKNVAKLRASLKEISNGNLDTVVNVMGNGEFASISNSINSTVATLKGYIAEAASRIDKDLALAKSIQHSALPSVFPPYPNRTEFDIYASMFTAKEVGGDFYDFYFVDTNKLGFLIADVSGKGIPAAMFMMTSKTLISGYAESGVDVHEVFREANNKLCENNEADMFVTAWMGYLDLETGILEFANAGHNPPLIHKKNGSWYYLKEKAGFVLAGIQDVPYKKQTLTLEKGDTIFLYTDGVTEATNSSNELYGEERLLNLLNSSKPVDSQSLCELVKKDLDEFVGEADQFDDITMVALKYKGDENSVNELNIEATLENIEPVTEFVDEQLEAFDCPMKAMVQINVAIDELFSNIARYAYNPETGPATVRVEVSEDPMAVVVTFIDEGVPYDPLSTAEPDITLSAEERAVGGLGIFLVKKTMDDISYEYKDGKNILKIKKNL